MPQAIIWAAALLGLLLSAVYDVAARAENLHKKYGPSWNCSFITLGQPQIPACESCEAQNMDFDWDGGAGGQCIPRAGIDSRARATTSRSQPSPNVDTDENDTAWFASLSCERQHRLLDSMADYEAKHPGTSHAKQYNQRVAQYQVNCGIVYSPGQSAITDEACKTKLRDYRNAFAQGWFKSSDEGARESMARLESQCGTSANRQAAQPTPAPQPPVPTPFPAARAPTPPYPGDVNALACLRVGRWGTAPSSYDMTNICTYDVIVVYSTKQVAQRALDYDQVKINSGLSIGMISYNGIEPKPLWACAVRGRQCGANYAHQVILFYQR
jgi:hypothetical protein